MGEVASLSKESPAGGSGASESLGLLLQSVLQSDFDSGWHGQVFPKNEKKKKIVKKTSLFLKHCISKITIDQSF